MGLNNDVNQRHAAMCAVERLELENRKLREALKPFAKAADCVEDDEANDYCLSNSSARYELTIGDLIRAKSAYG